MSFFDIFPSLHKAPIAWSLLFLIVSTSVTGFFYRPLYQRLLLHPYEVARGKRWYTLLTAAFVHTGWWHLTYNAILVFGFGYDFHGVIKQEVLPTYSLWITLLLTLLFIVIPNVYITWKNRNNLAYTTVGASGLNYAMIGFCTIIYPLEIIEERQGIPWLYSYHIWAVILVLLSVMLFRKGRTNHVIHLFAFLMGTLSAFLLRPLSLQQLIGSIF